MHLFDNIYEGYAYSYPHKHSYRKLEPVPLQSLWEQEKKDALFLYVHLPFCEMRCGFCNLFTIANPQGNMVDAYLKTLELEAKTLKEIINPVSFGQMAVGGGTPTFLDVKQLDKLFTIIKNFGADPSITPVSFEMSPKTITGEKLQFLAAQGVDRVSMGVQSFLESELKSLGRPQKNKEVYEAIEKIKKTGFETLNLDLIYGSYGQTLESWTFSVQEVINYKVEEVFIYPLYVRALTGITKLAQAAADNRFQLYQEAKQMLLAAGYEQISMRMFRLKKEQYKKPPVQYACQEDGMTGIGAGARSYTKALHYSSEYAVVRGNIKSIIEKYIGKNEDDFRHVDYGISLTTEEQKRRFLIKSLLHNTGLNTEKYRQLYGTGVMDDYAQLQQLIDNDLAVLRDGILFLTSAGIDYSDAIGPWFYSEPIRDRIHNFELQ